MATEKIHTTLPSDQSSAAAATTPSARVSGGLNTLHAYTEPMQMWMDTEAAATRQRLKPGGAMMCSFVSGSAMAMPYWRTSAEMPPV